MRLICEVENCGAELTEGTGSKGGPMMCPRCRSFGYHWKGRPLAELRERRQKIQFWSNRIDYLEPRILKLMNTAKTRVANAKTRARRATLVNKGREAMTRH